MLLATIIPGNFLKRKYEPSNSRQWLVIGTYILHVLKPYKDTIKMVFRQGIYDVFSGFS